MLQRPTSGVSGSCRSRDPSHRIPAWGRTCPPSCQTSTWTECRWGNRPSASWLLWGIRKHFYGTHTSPSHGLDHRNLELDTWRVQRSCGQLVVEVEEHKQIPLLNPSVLNIHFQTPPFFSPIDLTKWLKSKKKKAGSNVLLNRTIK